MKMSTENKSSKQTSVMNAATRLRHQIVQLEREVNLLRQFAFHDALTSLPNRRLLQDRLNQAIAQATRRNVHIALLFIDLDGFKKINDRFGHCVGDKLLQSVSKRLLSCVREADSVCRYGGDEFVILLTEIRSEKSAKTLAEKIYSRLADAYFIDKHTINLTASIGLAFYLETDSGYHDLIRQADLAMYMAKARTQPKRVFTTQ